MSLADLRMLARGLIGHTPPPLIGRAPRRRPASRDQPIVATAPSIDPTPPNALLSITSSPPPIAPLSITAPPIDSAPPPTAPVSITAPPPPSPLDRPAIPRGAHPLVIRRGATVTHVVVSAGDTLLEAGLAAGVPLAMSCTMGGCGTCAVTLVEGDVTLEEPNCLTDEEHALRIILPCIARPTSPCVIET